MTRTGFILLLASGALLAQPKEPRPAYEAASVKLNTSGINGSSSNGSGGQVVMTNLTLKRLVERAYSLKPYQVAGPSWMENVRVDIAAKYPPGTKTVDRPLMLRTLLEDRFKLAAHSETRDLPGYALVLAKGGFKLTPVEPGDYHINHDGDLLQVLRARKASMAVLAEHMARIMSDTVVDRTGIEGVYDFELRWTIENQKPDGSDPDANAALLFGLQNALSSIGVRLQPQKVPVEVIVVDHLERAPTEN